MESLIPCKCGNFRINARMIPHNAFPNIQACEQERFSRCVQPFMLRGKCISIKNPVLIACKVNSTSCSDVFCTCCKMTFRFFIGQGMIIYGGVVSEGRQGAHTPSPNFSVQYSLPSPSFKKLDTAKSLPHFLQPYFNQTSPRNDTPDVHVRFTPDAIDQLNTNYNQNGSITSETNDDEFNMMFSCKVDPVVGSYKQNMLLPNDDLFENISTEVTSSSYFV